MQFFCYSTESPRQLSTETLAELGKFMEEAGKSGVLVAGGGLQSTSTRLRLSGGKVSVTDGPFVETKEQVGGVFVIDARDLNEAILVASKHPAAHIGEHLGWGIEVRPIAVFEKE